MVEVDLLGRHALPFDNPLYAFGPTKVRDDLAGLGCIPRPVDVSTRSLDICRQLLEVSVKLRQRAGTRGAGAGAYLVAVEQRRKRRLTLQRKPGRRPVKRDLELRVVERKISPLVECKRLRGHGDLFALRRRARILHARSRLD